jgi:uncharacterized protein YjbI with pentapeptide repeats
MKNYLIICSFLLICTIGNVFGACSDAPRPYVDWRGCDKRGVRIVNETRPDQPIDMEGALIDGADFSGATINAKFSDFDYPLNNVKFDNVNFVTPNNNMPNNGSSFNYKSGIYNVSFRNSKGTLTIQSDNLRHLNFDNFMPDILYVHGNMNNVSFKNIKHTCGNRTNCMPFSASGINGIDVDFTENDFSEAAFSYIRFNIYFTNMRNVNLKNVNLQGMKFQENMLNNSGINFDGANLQLAYFGMRECQKGSIGRCWTMRDLNPFH